MRPTAPALIATAALLLSHFTLVSTFSRLPSAASMSVFRVGPYSPQPAIPGRISPRRRGAGRGGTSLEGFRSSRPGRRVGRALRVLVRGGDADTSEEDLSKKWLNWMTTGAPLSSPSRSSSKAYVSHNKVTYREDSNLGGIPRMERYTARDWLHNVYTLRTSSVLRQIKGPVTLCFWWGVLVSLLHRAIGRAGHAIGDHMLITKTPHSLLGSALGLLLVFRTNTAYARFWEGRKIWEKVASVSRDLSRMAMLYRGDIGEEKLERSMGLVAAFPYLLRQRVQPRWLLKKGDFGGAKDRFKRYRQSQDSDVGHNEGFDEEEGEDGEATSWVNTGKRPWRLLPEGTLESCVRSQNRPLWVCDRWAPGGGEAAKGGEAPMQHEALRLLVLHLIYVDVALSSLMPF
mmetsp:Transcript_15351/g.30573  ORF Transcript_15351/g.30573 Transcript_15351/m.30573 type:complete len:401 (+) Transcript_15351:183-1385(+)